MAEVKPETKQKVTLKKAEVAEKYECQLTEDRTVHVKGYSGKISGINMAGALAIIKDKNVFYLTEKTQATNKIDEKK